MIDRNPNRTPFSAKSMLPGMGLQAKSLQMHRTTYMVDEFIEEMKKVSPSPTMMAYNIEGAIEFKEMFA